MNTGYPKNIERILRNPDNEIIDSSFCNYIVSHQDLIDEIVMLLSRDSNYSIYRMCTDDHIQQTILGLLEAAIIYGCTDLISIIKSKYNFIDDNTSEHVRLLTIAKNDNNIFELMKNIYPIMYNAYVSQQNYENIDELMEIEKTCQMSSQYL